MAQTTNLDFIFVEKWIKMWEFYSETEKQFLEITRIIPLTNDPNTSSPRLYQILQSTCGQVENMLRLLCDLFSCTYERKNFPTLYKLLNKDEVLQMQAIHSAKKQYVFEPFIIEDGETPKWWNNYNKSKHNLPDGFTQGNLENTLNALSAAYCLHCIAFYAVYYKSDVLVKKFWTKETSVRLDSLTKERLDEDPADNRPKSNLFYCFTSFSKVISP